MKSLFLLIAILALKSSLSAGCCIPVKIVIETKGEAASLGFVTDPVSDLFAFPGQLEDFSVIEQEHCFPPSTTFTFIAVNFAGDGWNGGSLHLCFLFFVIFFVCFNFRFLLPYCFVKKFHGNLVCFTFSDICSLCERRKSNWTN